MCADVFACNICKIFAKFLAQNFYLRQSEVTKAVMFLNNLIFVSWVTQIMNEIWQNFVKWLDMIQGG